MWQVLSNTKTDTELESFGWHISGLLDRVSTIHDLECVFLESVFSEAGWTCFLESWVRLRDSNKDDLIKWMDSTVSKSATRDFMSSVVKLFYTLNG